MDVNSNSNIFLDTQTLKSIASIFIRSQEFPLQLCDSVRYQDESVEGILSCSSACHAQMNASATASRWNPKQ